MPATPLHFQPATELAKLPTYYVMDLGQGMAETVAPEMPTADAIAACRWLPDDELRVYSTEYGRIGFQGGLQARQDMGERLPGQLRPTQTSTPIESL